MIDLYTIKELMISCAELGAANVLKTLQPKSDDMTQREAYLKFGEEWVKRCKRNDLVKAVRRGVTKTSPIYYSKAELLSVRNAEKAARLGTFDNTNKI